MAREYFTNSWGYGVILISLAWIYHLACTPILGEKGKLPQISTEIDGALIHRLVAKWLST